MVSKLLIEPLVALVLSGPIALSDEVLGDNTLAELFNANANALVTMADRQSVSNAEGRWESIKNTGWLIFNAALPFLGKTVGTAAWIGQIMQDLEQVVTAREEGDDQRQSTAVTDILLNLGMALALHLASRRPSAVKRQAPQERALEEPTPNTLPSAPQKTTLETAQLPVGHESSLHTQGALIRTPSSLAQTLDGFSLAKPKELGAQHKDPGPYQHLYPLDEHWYAPVGQRWFQVVVDDNDCVIIVDHRQPTRLGPVLVNNRLGQWFVDTRLRLRGAGLRSRLKKNRRLRPPKISELRQQLEDFDDQSLQKTINLQKALADSKAVPGTSAQAAQDEFINKVYQRSEEYEVTISRLKSLNILDTVANYPVKMTRYLGQQLLLMRSAMDVCNGEYQALRDRLGPQLQNDAAFIDDHRRLYDLAGQLLQQLEQLDAHMEALRGLGADALKVAEETRRQLPGDKPVDLKSTRISLTRYLAVQNTPEAAQSGAREVVNRIVDEASLAIISVRAMQALPETTPLHERIGALDSLVDQFAVIHQDCLDLPGEFAGSINSEVLETTRRQIDEFAQQAARQLVITLRERRAQESKSKTTDAPPAPQRKIIKTRSRQVVIGEPRTDDPSLVEVKAPLTGKVVATFHEKTPGVWVQRVSEHSPAPAPPAMGLKASLKKAQALLDDADHFIERTWGLSGETRRLPVEIEEKVWRQAETLEAAANAVEHAANATNETDDRASRTVRQQLEEAVKKLYRAGREIKLDMLKKRPPTAAHVELLYIDKQITIQTLATRRRLKGPRKDYLQEYEIRDKKTDQVLWYAHFHYSEPGAANEHYTAAHLKTLEQRRLGGAFEQLGDSEQQRIGVYRSEIGPHLARLLFLNPLAPAFDATPGPSTSTPG